MGNVSSNQRAVRAFAFEGSEEIDMDLDTYIKRLQELRAEHGNLPVEKWMPAKGRHSAPLPELAYQRRYDKPKGCSGGELVGQFYHCDDNPVQKGAPTIRV
jgi:hypothetical protein